MAKPLLPDELWKRIEPLLPAAKPRRFRYPGRKPIDNRKALTGILFVLKPGIRWGRPSPQELGLWQRYDLLAATARLARGGVSAGLARTPAGRAERRVGPHRLVAQGRRRARPGAPWEEASRPAQTLLIGPNRAANTI